MNSDSTAPGPRPWLSVVCVIARLVLGGLYVFMGLSKALHPVEFLKLVRQYDLVSHPVMLNSVAATLPWFEVFCGLLLLGGIAVRGTALVSAGMLVPFTALVWKRALAVQAAGGLPFCAVRFDCGCGAGEVLICHKLLENSLLIALSALLVIVECRKGCLRYSFGSSQ